MSRTRYQLGALALASMAAVSTLAAVVPAGLWAKVSPAALTRAILPLQGPGQIVVTNTNDNGAGSLRQAVLDANAGPDANTILFDAGVFSTPQNITLTSGVIALSTDMTITGPGANLLTVSGGNSSRVFSIPETPTVAISGMTLSQGNGATGTSPGFGGAIYNQGTLTLTSMVLSNNTATSDGGGIYVSTGDFLTITNCTISNNTASRNGGGVYAEDGATLTVNNSIIRNNTAQTPSATAGGGGIYLDTATFSITDSTVSNNISNLNGGGLAFDDGGINTITRSTISGNTASAGEGGGMYVENTTLTVTNSTVSGNSAGIGGGMQIVPRGASESTLVTLSYSTVANNSATTDWGGIGAGDIVAADNTIIANNSTGGTKPDFSGTMNSGGYNLIENTTGATIGGITTGNKTGVDPNLGPLQDNGGPTHTHELLAASPAIDSSNPNTVPATDQRGITRPRDGDNDGTARGDIGAFELGGSSSPTPTPSPTISPTPNQTPTPEPTPTAGPTVSFSGQVTDSGGTGISGVTMTLAGTQSAVVQTDAGGNYSFTNLPSGGDYTVTPSKAGYSFLPMNQTAFALTTNTFGNFLGQTVSSPTPTPSPSPTPCGAAIGSCLDSGFDSDGKVATPAGLASDMAIQSDGKIVLVGGTSSINFIERAFRLARYNPNGSPDTSFGTNGMVTTDFTANQGDSISALAFQPDGKIVVAGLASPEAGGPFTFALARYNGDGTLDSSFGQAGKVRTDFFDSDDVALDVTIQPDGKIIAVGYTRSTGGAQDFAIARYNADGTLDATFAAGGRLTTGFFGRDDTARAVLLQADGKILVVGSTQSGLSATLFEFALARFNPNGTLDSTFDGDGKATTDFGSLDEANDVWLLADGRILVAGVSSQNFALAKYGTDGSLDTTFGAGGKVTTDFGANESANALTVQSDGRIVAAGNTVTCSNKADLAVARYNADGSLDPNFGVGGKASTDFFGQRDSATAVAIHDGKILAAGSAATSGALFDLSFALARFNLTGCGGPFIFTEDGTNRVAAVDSVTYVRGPFSIVDNYNFSSDRRTRISFFTSHLDLNAPDSSIFKVEAGTVSLLVEHVGPTSVFGQPASLVIVRLPDTLTPGDWPLTFTIRGITSTNSAMLSIVASPPTP